MVSEFQSRNVNRVLYERLLGILFLLAFLLFFSSVSVNAYTFSFKIPLGEPTLSQPTATAVDSTGNIYAWYRVTL